MGNAGKYQIDYIFTTSTYAQKAVGGVQNQIVFSHANQFVFLAHCAGLFCNRHIKLWTLDSRILRMYCTENAFWIVGHSTVTTQSYTNFEARMHFDMSFRIWIPGNTWPPFDKTHVKMVVIDWQGAQRSQAGTLTVLVQCRYELPWPNL